MHLHVWLAFIAASAVMGLAPGPAVTSIVGYALSSGRATALAAVAGLALGNLIAMTLSLGGVGALLSASAVTFAVLKWTGAAYLIGLGILTVLRSRQSSGETTPPAVIAPRTAFASNVALGTFHPKTIVFFVAFVPQFIDARGEAIRRPVDEARRRRRADRGRRRHSRVTNLSICHNQSA